MTLKTSFFNKGIYKSTIKRFIWGSVIYFVMLFISTVLAVISSQHYFPVNDPEYFVKNPLILKSSYLGFPLFLSIVVPSVTALLVFRFIHSKKQVVFTHSLPVSRRANYISSLLGGFTLMAIPLILNACILMICSLCGYDRYFTVANCVTWLWYNLTAVFMMYAPAVFCAVITGNSFAMVVLNILFHSILFLGVAAIGFIAEVFVYGLPSASEIADVFASTNYVNIIMSLPYDHFEMGFLEMAEIWLVPFVIYIGAYYLYKKRKSETASDVAGFSSLQGIFKYVLTFIASVLTFGFFGYEAGSNAAFYVILIIVSIICYFGCEMLVKKTTKVFYSYKGYLVFAVLFTAFISFFAFTSFFGYETNVPKAEAVESVAVYNYYNTEKEPFTSNTEAIKTAIEAHEEFVADIPTINNTGAIIHIKYKLKNGSALHRRYPVNQNKLTEIMNEIYEKDIDYKLMCEFGSIRESEIVRAEVDGAKLPDGEEELFEALKKDVTELSYDEIKGYAYEDKPTSYKTEHSNVHYGVLFEYVKEGEYTEDGYKVTRSSYYSITENYKHTIKWIEENKNLLTNQYID